MSADGQDRGRGEIQLDRQRGEAAGPPQDLEAVGADAGDGIVHRPHDRAIVDQEQIGDGLRGTGILPVVFELPQTAEALQGVVDLDGHRFLGEIAAGANQRPRD